MKIALEKDRKAVDDMSDSGELPVLFKMVPVGEDLQESQPPASNPVPRPAGLLQALRSDRDAGAEALGSGLEVNSCFCYEISTRSLRLIMYILHTKILYI